MLSLIRKAVAGTMTIQIPRLALNAKYAQGRDVALKITIEGYMGNWKAIESTDTDSTLDISFSNNNKFIEIIGTQAE
jgi:hypothetical protein